MKTLPSSSPSILLENIQEVQSLHIIPGSGDTCLRRLDASAAHVVNLRSTFPLWKSALLTRKKIRLQSFAVDGASTTIINTTSVITLNNFSHYSSRKGKTGQDKPGEVSAAVCQVQEEDLASKDTTCSIQLTIFRFRAQSRRRSRPASQFISSHLCRLSNPKPRAGP